MAERRAGSGHWLAQRLTALALAPLGFWFLYAVAARAGAGRKAVAEWIGEPATALALLALLAVGLWHALQGLEVVLVDYLRDAPRRARLLEALRWAALGLGALGALAIAALALGLA